ncbi:MAG: SIS domain-containing protein [Bacteroidota bacterium]
MSSLTSWLDAQIDEAARIPEAVRTGLPTLLGVAEAMRGSLDGGGRVFFFGNGGSAADAQHWAAELSGRFYLDRPSLSAQALTANTSALTAIGNDYGFAEVFARPLSGAGQRGDVAIGISTSGTSTNVLRAFEVARERGLVTVGFCGAHTEAFDALCDHVISIPSSDTPRIQEGHELAAHLVFAAVERMLFGDG